MADDETTHYRTEMLTTQRQIRDGIVEMHAYMKSWGDGIGKQCERHAAAIEDMKGENGEKSVRLPMKIAYPLFLVILVLLLGKGGYDIVKDFLARPVSTPAASAPLGP